MFRGYRLLFFALAGLMLSGAQQPKEQAQNHSSARQAEPTLSDYASHPCYQTENHDITDLCAQWRAAVAAEKAAHEARRSGNWSVIATLLSAIAIGGLFWTIRQGQVGLERARDANKIARDTAEGQLRAYISVTKLCVTPFKAGERPTFFVEFQNSGNSPAKDVKIISEAFFFPANAQNFAIHFTRDKRQVGARPTGAGHFSHSSYTSPTRMTKAQISSLENGNLIAFFGGIIRYRDVFNRVRRVTFLGSYNPGTRPREGWLILGVEPRGNRES